MHTDAGPVKVWLHMPLTLIPAPLTIPLLVLKMNKAKSISQRIQYLRYVFIATGCSSKSSSSCSKNVEESTPLSCPTIDSIIYGPTPAR